MFLLWKSSFTHKGGLGVSFAGTLFAHWIRFLSSTALNSQNGKGLLKTWQNFAGIASPAKMIVLLWLDEECYNGMLWVKNHVLFFSQLWTKSSKINYHDNTPLWIPIWSLLTQFWPQTNKWSKFSLKHNNKTDSNHWLYFLQD